MSKTLDLTKTVYELCKENPELPGIMAGLGFAEMSKKMALETVGRVMTIPKGAAIKGVDLAVIVRTLRESGFEVTGADIPEDPKAAPGDNGGDGNAAPEDDTADHNASENNAGDRDASADHAGDNNSSGNNTGSGNEVPPQNASDREKRNALLTSYVKRLSEGEDLQSVRKDFVENFSDVDAAEIAKAEETLITSGVPINDVQKLCDVHSALFHGATRTEQIANAEKAVQESMARENAVGAASGSASQNPVPGAASGSTGQGTISDAGSAGQGTISNAESTGQGTISDAAAAAYPGKPSPLKRQDGGDLKYQELCRTEGHPLQIFYLENKAITAEIGKLRDAVAAKKDILPELDKTRQLAVHYAKKGDLLYPLLKTGYDFSGPSNVMWGVDDEIRDELRKLSAEAHRDESKLTEEKWNARLDAVLTRAEEMVYKEENILLPLCAKFFSEEQWKQIARDMKDYEFCLIEPVPFWKDAEQTESAALNTSGAASGNTGSSTAPSGNGSAVEAENTGSSAAAAADNEIHFASGHMTVPQIEAMLNTIPLELTFVDAENINRFFNDNGEPKLFKRPLSALDREVFTCHPPKVEPMVRGIIQQFRDGARDSVEVWNSRGGEPVLIRYMAVRDKSGAYLGTLECVQRMGFAEEHFKK